MHEWNNKMLPVLQDLKSCVQDNFSLWSCKWKVCDWYQSEAAKQCLEAAVTIPTHMPDGGEDLQICAGFIVRSSVQSSAVFISHKHSRSGNIQSAYQNDIDFPIWLLVDTRPRKRTDMHSFFFCCRIRGHSGVNARGQQALTQGRSCRASQDSIRKLLAGIPNAFKHNVQWQAELIWGQPLLTENICRRFCRPSSVFDMKFKERWNLEQDLFPVFIFSVLTVCVFVANPAQTRQIHGTI